MKNTTRIEIRPFRVDGVPSGYALYFAYADGQSIWKEDFATLQAAVDKACILAEETGYLVGCSTTVSEVTIRLVKVS